MRRALVGLLAVAAVVAYTRPGRAAVASLGMYGTDDLLALMSGSERNVEAFLQMLRVAEGTAGPNGYYTLYGGQFFLELDTHPAVRAYGEFREPGKLDFTTAAGAYQETLTTWRRLSTKLGTVTFDERTQDLHARELIREAGALDDVREGRFDEAVRKVSGVWASLPFASVPQPRKSLESVRAAYVNAGGEVAA